MRLEKSDHQKTTQGLWRPTRVRNVNRQASQKRKCCIWLLDTGVWMLVTGYQIIQHLVSSDHQPETLENLIGEKVHRKCLVHYSVRFTSFCSKPSITSPTLRSLKFLMLIPHSKPERTSATSSFSRLSWLISPV